MKQNKINKNLLADYDCSGTEANIDIIGNIQVKPKNKEILTDKNVININNNSINKFLKPAKEKKEYRTIYINSSYTTKIKRLAKLTNRTFGELIEISIDEFLKNQNIEI